MLRSHIAALLLIACPLTFAQTKPTGGTSHSAMDKVRAEYTQNLVAGSTIDFYCLITAIDHPSSPWCK
jgi:hypothetical protein